MTPAKRIILFSISALSVFLLSLGLETELPPNIDDGGSHEQRICNEGLFMHIDRDTYIAGETLFFKIYLFNDPSRSFSDSSMIAYVILRDVHNIPVIRQNILLSQGTAYSSFYLPDTLLSGYYQVVAFTNKMRNFGELTFFTKELIITNRFDEELAFEPLGFIGEMKPEPDPGKTNPLLIRTDKSVYNTREKVIITLSAPDNSVKNLSVSVAEMNGHCRNSSNGSAIINKNNKCDYLVENKGYIISGKVNRPYPFHDIMVTLSVPDTIVNLMYATTDASGKFYFQLGPYYYNKELFIGIPDRKTSMETVLTIDDKYALQSPVLCDPDRISPDQKQIIRKSQKIVSIQKAYQVSSGQYEPPLPPIETCRKVYYKPDHLLRTTDYEPMSNFVEIVREALLFVRVNKADNLYKTEVLNPQNKTVIEDPMIFINGMAVRDINPIINFGSEKIKRIETVYRNRVYGSLELKGILAVFTTNDVKTDEFIDQGTVIVKPVVFLRPSRFNTPDYSSPEKRTARFPDFRQLLFWNPEVNIQGGRSLTLEFYTSDNTGSYEINIRGLASDGSIISSNATFQVQ